MSWIDDALTKVKQNQGETAPFVTINVSPTPTTWARLLFTRTEVESPNNTIRELILHKAGTVQHHPVA